MHRTTFQPFPIMILWAILLGLTSYWIAFSPSINAQTYDVPHHTVLPGVTSPSVSPRENQLTHNDGVYHLSNPHHKAQFSTEGVHLQPRYGGPDWFWQLSAVYASHQSSPLSVDVGPVAPVQYSSDLVVYPRKDVIEQYVLHKDSIEQQFILPHMLTTNDADLVIEGDIDSDGVFASGNDSWSWHNDEGVVHLGDVFVFDATGVEVPAYMEVDATSTRIVVDGVALAQATYPVTIDPVIGANDQRLSDMGGLGTANIHIADNPAIAFNNNDNEYFVVWEGTENNAATEQTQIYGQRINAETGAEIGTNDILVGTTPGGADPGRDAATPAIVYNATNNEYLVIWVGQPNVSSTEPEVYGQRVAANGSLAGSAFLVSECGAPGNTSADVGITFGYPIDMAYNSTDNQYLVVWRCDDVGDGGIVNGEFEIFGRIVNADGTLAGSDDFQISQTAGANGSNVNYDAETPAVAYNSVDNEYLVTWGADNPSLGDGNREIFGQRLSNTGAEVGTNDFQISTTTHGGSRDSSVSDVVHNSTSNEYLVVWSGDIVTDDVVNIFGQRIVGATGAFSGSRINISQTGTAANPSNEPEVVYNSRENTFTVVWQAAQTAGELEIYGQHVSATGAAIGPNDFRISDMGNEGDGNFDANESTGLAYAGNNLNSYYVVWGGQDNRGGQVASESEILGQAIEPVLEINKTITTQTTGVDAGDTVRYQIEVRHKQVTENSTTFDVSLRDAYNLNITDDLPDVLGNASIVSAEIRDGVAPPIDLASAFTINASGDLTTTGNVDLLRGTTNGTNHQHLIIVIEAQARNTVEASTAIMANTANLTWQNYNPGLVHPAYDDSATTTTIDIAGTLAVTKTTSPVVTDVVIGDVVTYQFEVTVIEGTTNNLQFVDTLPGGMSYVANSLQVSNANGMTVNGLTDNGGQSVQTLTIDIDSVINPGNVDDAANADSDSFFITYQVLIDNVVGNQDGVTLTNDVDVSADNVGSDNDNQVTVTIREPELTITKTADDVEPAMGQSIQYTVGLTHTASSSADAYDIVITDTLPAGLEYDGGSASIPPSIVDGSTLIFRIPSLTLAANNTQFTYEATVGNPPEVNIGDTLTNTQLMTWTSRSGTNMNERTGAGGVNDYRATASEIVTVNGSDLTLTKDDGDVTVIPGDTIAYTLTYTNTGNQGATGVVLMETVPGGTSFDAGSSTAGWSCVPDGQAGSTCTLAVGSVVAGGQGSATFAVVVADPLGVGITQLTNSASIADDGSNGADPTPGDNSASDTTPVIAAPDLILTKDDGGIITSPGGDVAYTLTYTNTGNQGATGVVLMETVPGGTSFDAGSSTAGWSCVPDGQAGSTCTLAVGSVVAGGQGSATFAVVVADPLGVGITQLTNSASIADDGSNGADPTPGDNSASDTTPVSLAADLQIEKIVTPSVAFPGQPITYTLSFVNDGPQVSTHVVITDIIPSEFLNVSFTSDLIITDTNTTPAYVWEVGTLNAGVGGTITVTGDIPTDLATDLILTNTTTIAGDFETNPVDNSDDALLTVTVPRIQFSDSDYSVIESAGTALITVTLDTANPFADTTVEYVTADETATVDDDYTATNGTLMIPAGATSATFSVPINDDQLRESAETVLLTLNNSTGAGLSTPETATLTIIDNESADIQVAPTNMNLIEGGPSANYEVVLTTRPIADVSVVITNDGQLEITPEVLSFTPENWDAPQSVQVSAVDDVVIEGDHVSIIEHSSSSTDSNYDDGNIENVVVSIEDNDSNDIDNQIYLPLIIRPGIPDLVVSSIRVDPDKMSFTAGEEVQITITIENQGTGFASPFWVDLYLNPDEIPVSANVPWQETCTLDPCYGLVWSTTEGLAPGESMTLTSTTGSIANDYSRWPGFFVAGTTDIYVYIDSWNPGVVDGAVAESNETNNRTELLGLDVTGPNPPQVQGDHATRFPLRPALPQR